MPEVIFGLGDHSACLRVFIGNQPELPKRLAGSGLHPLADNDMADLVTANSNHWRKVFNIYAKLCFEIFLDHTATTWQDYRERYLLRHGENHSLVFTPWSTSFSTNDAVNIICGKTYAQNLGLLEKAQRLHDGFFNTVHHNTFIAPYFDYRALSNTKVRWLINYLQTLPPITRHQKSGA